VRRWKDYRAIAPETVIDEALELGRSLRGVRVLHINATAFGGGVAELLDSEIGLLRDAGVHAEWCVLCPDAELFEITKRIHNGMQGKHVALSKRDIEIYLEHNRHCAGMVGEDWDLIVVHDPQPAGLIEWTRAPATRWIWRCHIDTSAPDPAVWHLLDPFIASYDRVVFTLDSFRPADIDPARAVAIAPAIDPLAIKNTPLEAAHVHRIIAAAGIDPSRPLMLQVSRFDPWKDPLGVIEAWRLARGHIAGLQLALVGSMADDDPEGLEIYETVRAATASEDECHLLTNREGIGALEVNALQRHADVAVQKSLREGFGLTVSEALWKGTPVVGGNAGGIPMQIGDGEAGILVNSVEACADAVVTLLRDTALARELGQAGHERVRRDYLMPRLARDDLALYAQTLAASTKRAENPTTDLTPPPRRRP
jgi:trehalose synthase